MRVPARLDPLMAQGVIDHVIRPLMSGKEAQIYLVETTGEQRVAKVYKESNNRSFHQRADYTEGRRGRNSRSQRAMARRSRFGREQAEAAWRTAEVDAIYKLAAAGVRVPQPYDFIEGVLIMELIADHTGEPAPRLVDLQLTRNEAEELFEQLLREVVRMLLAGVVHGDLSDFNVLVGANGPVIIDFPQVVDPAFNRNARKLLVRDVKNLQHFLSRFSGGLRGRQFGEEIWSLYEKSELTVDSPLTGRWRGSSHKADVQALLDDFDELERESLARREELGLGPPRPAHRIPVREVIIQPPAKPAATAKQHKRRRRRRGGGKPPTGPG